MACVNLHPRARRRSRSAAARRAWRPAFTERVVFEPAEEVISGGESDGYNVWHTKTIETLSDGSRNIAYCNSVGQIMLLVFASTEGRWATFSEFNADAGVILRASPAAIAGYDETNDALVTLRPNTGLIEYSHEEADPWPYALGIVREISEGAVNSHIVLRKDFFTIPAENAGYRLAQFNVYSRGADDPDVTRYEYDWDSATGSVQQMRTIWPAVPAETQNGSGVSDQREEVYAPNGQLLWLQDERGFITQYLYDEATGAPVSTVRDYQTAGATGVPSGWTTPPGE